MKSKEEISAKEFWKLHFDEYPQNDAEKLAVAMMQEYAHLFKSDESPKEDGEDDQDEMLAEVIAFFFKSSDPLAWREQFKSKFHITKKSNQ